MKLAPILLFTYKRMDTLEKTVESLKHNDLASESDLYVFSDGPKSENDVLQILRVRNYLKTVKGFKKVIIKEAETNKGLAKSIIDGVTEVINMHGKAIVLEDDLITSPNFLTFMNACLFSYENTKNVFSVSGYAFDMVLKDSEKYDATFINRGWSWGWATWRDRWDSVDWEMKDYEEFKNNTKERRKFGLGGSDLNGMLDKQMNGSLDSWAIRWFYCQYKIMGLTVYPLNSKVQNIGFDKDATHTKGSNKRYNSALDQSSKTKFILPENAKIDPFYQAQFNSKMGFWARLKSKIETYILKV